MIRGRRTDGRVPQGDHILQRLREGLREPGFDPSRPLRIDIAESLAAQSERTCSASGHRMNLKRGPVGILVFPLPPASSIPFWVLSGV